MTINVVCDSCEYTFNVDSRHDGKRIRCPSCEEPVLVGSRSVRVSRRRHSTSRESFHLGTIHGQNKTFYARIYFMVGLGVGAAIVAVSSVSFLQQPANATGNNNEVDPPDSGLVDDGVRPGPLNSGGSNGPTKSTPPSVQTPANSVPRLTLDTEPLISSFTGWDDLNEQVATSVVHVEVSSGGGQNKREGSGFILHSSGIILTSYHVIAGADEIEVRIAGRRSPVTGYVFLDQQRALAMLQIESDTVGNPLRALPLSDVEPRNGEQISACGFSSRRDFSASRSNVSGYRSARELATLTGVRGYKGHWVQHTAAVPDGYSGGPLINQTSRVVGMNLMTVERGDSVSLAIAAEDIRNAFAERTVLQPVTPQAAPQSHLMGRRVSRQSSFGSTLN